MNEKEKVDQSERDKINQELRNEYIRMTKQFIKEVGENIDGVVEATVQSKNAETVEKVLKRFERNINKFDSDVDAIVEALAHVMAQNEAISELLVVKGIITSKDISKFNRITRNRVRTLVGLINKSVCRETKPIDESKHSEVIKLLKSIKKVKNVKKGSSKVDNKN